MSKFGSVSMLMGSTEEEGSAKSMEEDVRGTTWATSSRVILTCSNQVKIFDVDKGVAERTWTFSESASILFSCGAVSVTDPQAKKKSTGTSKAGGKRIVGIRGGRILVSWPENDDALGDILQNSTVAEENVGKRQMRKRMERKVMLLPIKTNAGKGQNPLAEERIK